MLQIPQVYRGHFDECWTHFSQAFHNRKPPGSMGVSQARAPIREFCGVSDQTVKRWMVEEYAMPAGEVLIKALCYLYLHGYKIIEFERLSIPIRGVAELIGFGLVSTIDTCRSIGYAQPSTLYDVVWGRQSPSEQTIEKMRMFWKEKKGDLERRKKDAFDSCRIKMLTEHTTPTEPDQQISLLSVTEYGCSRRKSAVSIMRGLLGFFQEGEFDNLSHEDLRALSVEADTILELSARLSSLSSSLISINRR